MNGLSNIKKGMKRTSAVVLAALILASGAESALVSASAAEVETSASTASTLSNEDRGVLFANSRSDFRDESIYFLITTRFYDGDSSNNARTSEDKKAQNPESDPSWRGDFKGLIDKLDYIKALGFTAIWITPVVENDSGYDYHGYHAYDFSAVDTRYESNGVTYQTLIDACHDKGMKVIQDIVLNHTCNWGERNLLQITSDVYSERNQVVMNGKGDPENIYHHNGFCGGGDWDNQEAQKKTIADDCFDLNTENPKVYNYLVDCYTNYINMGVDGFRVDTVKHISRLTFNSVFLPAFKQAGGEKFYMFGEVCTKGHDVWYRDNPPISTCFYTWADDSSWTSRWSNDEAANTALLDEHYQAHMDTSSQPTSTNAFLNGNDYHTPDNSKRSGMDSIDFQMHWSFNSANQAFNTALGEDRYFSDSTWNVVYVDSHDYGPDQSQTLRYNGGTDAWAENLSLMFTFRGIPCIYYGSEIEFQAGMPIDVGPNAPLSQTGRAYYGDHIEGTVGTSDFTVFGNVSGEIQNTLNSTLSQHIMRLNRIRQAVPALRKGQYSTEGCSGSSGMAFKRRYTDSTTDSFACVTISGGATFSGVPNGTYVDAVTGDVQTVTGGTLTANCSGKGNLRVYVLNTAKTPAPGRVIPNGDYLTDGGAAEKIGPVPLEKVDVTAVDLDQHTLTIVEGASEKLNATISPSNATNKSLTWTSSNPSVAAVVNGTVTGVGKGTAVITVSSNNDKTDTCTVTVTEDKYKPTGITLDKSAIELTKGDTASLTATVTPSNASNKTVTWTSDNTAVATVSNGTVTAVSAGTATITASTFNGYTASCTITVSGPTFQYVDKGFYFEKPLGWGSNINVYFFNKSSDTQVGAAWPGTAMKDIGDNIYSLEYTNTDSNVVMIFNDGNNQSPGQGQGGFEIKDQGYYTSSGFDHIVEKTTVKEVTSVTLNQTSLSLNAGSTASLTAAIAPSDATNKTITWSSSNTSVAKVSSTGVVTGVAEGTATITAKSNNGKTATCTVTVASVVDFTNTSTLSATTVAKGSTITVKASAAGGSAPYKYTYSVKRASASSWTVKATDTSSTTLSLTPNYVEKYYVKVVAKDSAGTTSAKTLSFTVTDVPTELTNNSSLSATTITKGTSVTVKGAASGGTSPYKYTYQVRGESASSWTTKATSTTSTSITLTPSTAQKYYVRVIVTDSANKTASKTLVLNVTAPVSELKNTSTLSATTVTKGTTVTINGSATGGSGSYKYAFYVKQKSAANWTLKGTEFGTAKTATITPSAAVPYQVMVQVLDGSGAIVSKTINLTVNDVKELQNNSTLSATSTTTNTAVTVKAAATGGTTPYKYTYQVRRASASSWTTKAENTTAASITLTPTQAETYYVKVAVVDAKGTRAAKTLTLKVTKPVALVNNSTLSASTTTVGKSITVNGAAAGGSGSYKYTYQVRRASASSWTTKASNTTATSVTLTPTQIETYYIMVTVTDSNGNIASKTLTTKVASAELTNTSTLSASSVKKNTEVTVKGAATGGSGSYKYTYEVRRASASSWTTKASNTTATSVKLTPTQAETYYVRVKVTDSAGKTASLTLKLAVS